MGRPSKFTPRVHDRLVTLAAAGTPLNTAARYLGLDPGTVSRWLTAGRRSCEAADVELTAGATEEELARSVGPGKEAVTRLYLDVRLANAQPALRATSALQRAIEAGDWRAAKNYLVRHFPNRPRTPTPCPEPRVKDPVAGRPTKLSPRVHDERVRLVAAGNTLVDAVNAAGINESTLHRWLKRGRATLERADAEPGSATTAAGDTQGSGGGDWGLADLVGRTEWPYVRLYLDVSQAAAAVAMQAIQVWNAAMETDWCAAADFLAYRFPERWAPAKTGSRPEIPPSVTQH